MTQKIKYILILLLLSPLIFLLCDGYFSRLTLTDHNYDYAWKLFDDKWNRLWTYIIEGWKLVFKKK